MVLSFFLDYKYIIIIMHFIVEFLAIVLTCGALYFVCQSIICAFRRK